MAKTIHPISKDFPQALLLTLLLVSLMFISPATSHADSANPSTRPDKHILKLYHRPADHPEDKRLSYFTGLLRLALDKTVEDYGPYTLSPKDEPINQERSFMMVSQNKLDVTWGMTSNMREIRTQPIRIPLMKGLLGYRMMLINRKRAVELSTLDSKEELSRYVMIQGNGWPDVAILRDNGFPVRTHTQYAGLFQMLSKDRVDLFPRSIAEVWLELERDITNDLMLKEDLVLQYISPIYFFVPLERVHLAERIETGLERAIADGSFDHYFRTRPELKKALNLLNNTDYTLIRLQGPSLHPKTPLNRPELWFKPERDSVSADRKSDRKSDLKDD